MFGPFFLLPLFILAFFVALIVALVTVPFVVIGGPSACEPGGAAIVISEQNADAFQQKWDAFDAALDAGTPATVTFSESEVSSRAVRAAEGRVDDQDFVQNFQVCLHDGYGEISGSLNLPAFLDTRFKVRGTATIEDNLVVKVDRAELGSIPGFLEDWASDRIDDTIDVLGEDEFGHHYVLTLREGEAQIDGTP